MTELITFGILYKEYIKTANKHIKCLKYQLLGSSNKTSIATLYMTEWLKTMEDRMVEGTGK